MTHVCVTYKRLGEMLSLLPAHPGEYFSRVGRGVLVRCGGALDSVLQWRGAFAAKRY